MYKLLLSLFFIATPVLAADLVIGQSAPLTGANADLGKDIRDGALAYFGKINAAGGIGGKKITLVTLDDKNDAKLAAENTKTLVTEQKVVALFGYASSTLSVPAMPLVKEQKVPFFAPFTGADAIRVQNDFVYTIRATYADEIQKIVGFWGGVGASQVTVLHYNDAIGKQNFETVSRALEKFGKKPVSVAIARNVDISPADVQAVIASDPQILVVTTLYAPIAQLVTALKAQNKQYVTTSLSFAGASQLAKALGKNAAGISVALTVPLPSQRSLPVVKECNDAWAAAERKDALSVTALEACIAAKILVSGLQGAGREPSRATLQKSLSALSRVDTGGYVVEFKPNFRHGGKFVDIAVFRQNGELKQ